MEQEPTGPAVIQAVDTAAASQERNKFRRSVGRWDTTFLMLAAIIVLDTLGAVSSYGAQAFTWLIVMVVFFLVPYGLITAELGTAFPEEGGPYVWVRLAFGRAAAAVVAVMYWVDNPIWLAGTLSITAMAAFSTFFVNLSLSLGVCLRAGVHLGRYRLGDHGPEVRQVGRHHRRGHPHRADRLLHHHRARLRGRARPARLRRRVVQAHLAHLPGRGAHPDLQPRGLRAAERGGRGTGQPRRRTSPSPWCAPGSPPCSSTGSRSWPSCWCSRRRGCPTWAVSSTPCSRYSSSTGAT